MTNTSACRSLLGRLLPALSLAICLAALGVGVALAASAGSYSGTTSEQIPVKLTIKGSAIKNFSSELGYNGKCGPGGGPGLTVKVATITIGHGGKFTKSVTLSFANGIHDPGKITGRASGRKVTGTIVQYSNGKPNRCYTETFTATKV